MNAIVTITCTGAGAAGQTGAGDAGEIIIVDTSGSMGRMKLEAAVAAASSTDSRRNLVRGGGRHASGLSASPPVRTGTGMVLADAHCR